MASAERKPDSTLIDELATHGDRFGFFPAVALLHRLSDSRVPVGELGPVSEEAVRFRHATSLCFHAGDIEDIQFPAQGMPQLTSTFLGLFGSVSPLSTQYCEDVIRAEQDDQPQLR